MIVGRKQSVPRFLSFNCLYSIENNLSIINICRMKNFFTKSIAIFFLALYAVNPLHTVLHSCHDHNHHGECPSSSKSADNSKLESFSFHLNDIHDCFLCQNSQDKTHSLLSHPEVAVKENTLKAFPSKIFDSRLISLRLSHVNSRGPPA